LPLPVFANFDRSDWAADSIKRPELFLSISRHRIVKLPRSTARVYIYEPYHLAAFFADLAAQWKGWAGEKEWHSVEDDFALSCTSDPGRYVN
jgi:hypothetical protein